MPNEPLQSIHQREIARPLDDPPPPNFSQQQWQTLWELSQVFDPMAMSQTN